MLVVYPWIFCSFSTKNTHISEPNNRERISNLPLNLIPNYLKCDVQHLQTLCLYFEQLHFIKYHVLLEHFMPFWFAKLLNLHEIHEIWAIFES